MEKPHFSVLFATVLPLHVAVTYGVNGFDIETFTMILEGFPEACNVRGEGSYIPLNRAIFYPHFEVTEALVRAFPDSLKIKDVYEDCESCLVHSICENYLLTETFIAFLSDNHPEVFLFPDVVGRVPLHYAINGNHDLSADSPAHQNMVVALIRACPEAASVADDTDGLLPLHGLQSLNATGARALVEAYPEAVVTKDGDLGQTPLHLLLADPGTFSLEVAKVLVAARPDVLMLKDDEHGNIPLSTAVESDAGLPTVEWLVNACPESVKVANING